MIADYVSEKNYLTTDESHGLNLIYLDYEENLARPLRHPGIGVLF